MTSKQYWLLCALGAVCVVLAIEQYRVSRSLQLRQERINALQASINGGLVNRFGPKAVEAVLVDMANISATNAQLRQVLTDHGYSVNFNAPPSQKPATNGINSTTNPPSH